MTNSVAARLALAIFLPAALLSACGPSNNDPLPGTASVVPDIVTLPFGKPGSAPGVTVTVSSVKQVSHIGEKGFGPAAAAGETFVVVRYVIKNTADKPLPHHDRPKLTLVDQHDHEYAEDRQSSLLEAGLNGDFDNDPGDLNPGVSAKNTAIWKVTKASFDQATWKLKATFDEGYTAMMQQAARWPLDTKLPPALLFKLK